MDFSDKLLARQQLLQSLQAVLTNQHLFITAPPGYGKTILLQQLALHRPQSHYLLLTAADGDTPVLQRRQPHQQPGHVLLLDDIHHLADSETAVAWLREQLAQTGCRWAVLQRQRSNLTS